MRPERVSHLPGVTQQIDDEAPHRSPSPDLRFTVQSNMKCPLLAHSFFYAFQNGFPGFFLVLGSRRSDSRTAALIHRGVCSR